MNRDEFEWDDAKAIFNHRRHGIDFEEASQVFADIYSFETLDDRFDYGEDRFNTTGMVDGVLITVTHTTRGAKYRLISARIATRYEQDRYYREAFPER